MRFSANLGFLWADRSLPDAIRAAKAAGFDAVECHWPYDTPATDTRAALQETGLAMLGLNTHRGNTAIGENGLAALPSATNFVAIDAGHDGVHARAIVDGLMEHGVFIRMPGVAPLNRCIRVSTGLPADLDLFEEALPKVLASLR